MLKVKVCSGKKVTVRKRMFLKAVIKEPWRYVHPQTNHVTFRPTPYVHPTFCPLWQFSTATLRPCDIFLLRHSDSVTIFYCDIPSQSGRIVRPPQKMDILSHCDIPTHCNFGQPMDVTFCPLRISIFPVDTLSKLPPIWTDDNFVTLSP
jgi:hypothetical protein